KGNSVFREQCIEPYGIEMAEPEASQAEGAVCRVETETSQQENDHRAVSPPHTHTQSPTQLLLMHTTAD
ncbi:uncharacterized, partial [Tachysurus ichikawai]